MDGIREARLVGMAEDLAASGYDVLTVATPDLQKFRITPTSTDIIEDAAVWLAGQQPAGGDGKIGMLGISFSGGLSIVAAGRPDELMRPRGVELETNGGTRLIDGATRDDVPRLVAELVEAGESVYGVRVLHSTLEDVYLDAVGEEP